MYLLRKDCYFYYEEQDMGAHIPCCSKEKILGKCPCSFNCKKYISQNEINEVINNYINNKDKITGDYN